MFQWNFIHKLVACAAICLGVLCSNLAYPQAISATTPGKLIGYVYGYTPPPATDDIIAAGYTHIIISSVPFYSSSGPYPGMVNMSLLTGFNLDPSSTASNSLSLFIANLHKANIKVLLSIGGTIYGTYPSQATPYFSQAVQTYQNPDSFIKNFIGDNNTNLPVDSLAYIKNTWAFDGFDFNIEGGLATTTYYDNAMENFTNPGAGCSVSTYAYDCTSFYLYTLLNTLHTSLYSYAGATLLLSLPPQYSQISANTQYNSIYTLFAPIVMETYPFLSWVAPQVYNPGDGGSVYAINGSIYPLNGETFTSSPDTGVALAVDMLSSWPTTIPPYGTKAFLPYVGNILGSQAALGYAISNSLGYYDGDPIAQPAVVENTVACIRNGLCCGAYKPKNVYTNSVLTYPDFAGVFAFTVNSDAAQGFAFAGGKNKPHSSTQPNLYKCVVLGDCICQTQTVSK